MKKLLIKCWEWTKPYLTWRMAPCLAIAWCITNGWAYVFVIVGPIVESAWLSRIGWAWITILWMPWTPEKFLITIPLSVLIYRVVYRQNFVKKVETES